MLDQGHVHRQSGRILACTQGLETDSRCNLMRNGFRAGWKWVVGEA